MISIGEIARKAGVSPTTVSRALSQDKTLSIKDSTRKKVLEVASNLHYDPHPSHLLININNRKRKIIILYALSVEQLNRDLCFSNISQGLQEEANTSRYIVSSFIHFPKPNFDFPSIKNSDGIVIIGALSSKFIKRISFYNPSIVIISEYRRFDEYDLIHNNYFGLTNRVLNILYQREYTRIGFIGGYLSETTHTHLPKKMNIDPRTKAYETWMKLHNLPINEMITNWTLDEGYSTMDELPNSSNPPKIVPVANDVLAMGAYRSVRLHQKEIPTDIQIISCNNSEVASYLVPPLSSVSALSYQIGQAVIRLLYDRFINHRITPYQLLLPSRFIERESSIANEKNRT